MAIQIQALGSAVNLARALQGYKMREPGSSRTSGTIRELLTSTSEKTKLRYLSFDGLFPATAKITGEYVKEVIKSSGLTPLQEAAVIRAYRLTIIEIRANKTNYPSLTDAILDDIFAKTDKFVNEFNKQAVQPNDIIQNKTAEKFNVEGAFNDFRNSLEKLNTNFIKFFVIRENIAADQSGLKIPSIRLVGRSYSYLRGELNRLLSKNLKIAIAQLNSASQDDKKALEGYFELGKAKAPTSSKLTETLSNWGHTAYTIQNILTGKPETIILSGKIMATLLSIGRSIGPGPGQLSETTAQIIQQDFVGVTGQITSSIDFTQPNLGKLELRIASSGYFQQIRPESRVGNQGRGSTVEQSWGLSELLKTNSKLLNDLGTLLLGSNQPVSPSRVMGALIDIKASPTYKQNVISAVLSPLTGDSFKFKPTKAKLLDKSKKTVGKLVNNSKRSKLPKTPGSALINIRPVPQQSIVDLSMLMMQINSNLHDQIKRNMGTGNRRDVLNYRSGRFAESAKVERLSESRQGMITAFYSYMKNPYATFSRGGRQERPYTRDPKLLISKSIRELAGQQVANRMRAVNV